MLDPRLAPLRRSTHDEDVLVVWLVLGLGLVGLWSLRRSSGMTPLLLAVGYLTLVTILVSPAAPRLRAPLDVGCCVGAGALVTRRSANA